MILRAPGCRMAITWRQSMRHNQYDGYWVNGGRYDPAMSYFRWLWWPAVGLWRSIPNQQSNHIYLYQHSIKEKHLAEMKFVLVATKPFKIQCQNGDHEYTYTYMYCNNNTLIMLNPRLYRPPFIFYLYFNNGRMRTVNSSIYATGCGINTWTNGAFSHVAGLRNTTILVCKSNSPWYHDSTWNLLKA